MSQFEWYYARENKQMGPVSAVELKRLATAGELRPDDLVWREGMTEWSVARNVRGLFDDGKPAGDSAIGQAAGSTGVPGGATGSASAAPETAASPPQRAAGTAGAAPAAVAAPPVRHFLDGVLDRLRRRFDASSIERTAKVFWACGFFGLFAGMAFLALCTSILAVKDNSWRHVLWGVLGLLALVALQYAAAKFSDVLDRLLRGGGGGLASSAFPDCFALLTGAAAVAALPAALAASIAATNYTLILLGVAAFLVFGRVALIALHPTALGMSIVPDIALAEEAIGILSFLLRVFLRAVPVAFGVGVLYGALMIAYACGLPFAPGDHLKNAIDTAISARDWLLRAAALPLVAYLAFLLGNLILSIWRAVLSLPAKIDGLGTKNRE